MMVYFLEGWGVLGILLVILVLSGYRAWKSRASLKLAMKQIEMMIWQKPLDKDMWKKGEMKDTKVRVTFGKGTKWKWYEYSNILLYPSLLLLIIGLGFNITSLTYISFTLLGVMFLGIIMRKVRGRINAQDKKHGIKQ